MAWTPILVETDDEAEFALMPYLELMRAYGVGKAEAIKLAISSLDRAFDEPSEYIPTPHGTLTGSVH